MAKTTIKAGAGEEKKQGYGYGAQPYVGVKSKVLSCSCGTKYIKTRAGQSKCFPCMFGRPYRSR